MSDFINLGENPSENTPQIAAPSDAKEYFPSLYFSNKEALKDLPKSGTAIIKYKKVMEREETTEREGEKKTRYTTELEIHAIKAGEADESEAESAKETTSNEDAIEKGLEAASESQETSTEE